MLKYTKTMLKYSMLIKICKTYAKHMVKICKKVFKIYYAKTMLKYAKNMPHYAELCTA